MLVELHTDIIAESDDYKHAIAILTAADCHPGTAFRVEIAACWCATLREYYVQVGREMERDK